MCKHKHKSQIFKKKTCKQVKRIYNNFMCTQDSFEINADLMYGVFHLTINVQLFP